MKKQKKILITGGAGFIGSHLCERLLAMALSTVDAERIEKNLQFAIQKLGL